MRQKPVVLTGKTTIDQLTSILSMVDLLVTNDTGPAHIAAALGHARDFGPTNPLTTRPLSGQAEVLRHLRLRPCMLRDCPVIINLYFRSLLMKFERSSVTQEVVLQRRREPLRLDRIKQ